MLVALPLFVVTLVLPPPARGRAPDGHRSPHQHAGRPLPLTAPHTVRRVACLTFRDAVAADVPVIVALYADDSLGETRERPVDPLPDAYWRAFREIDSDPRHRLLVAEQAGEIVATLQLSFLPHLVLAGTERAQIEAVRVRSSHRGQGLGRAVFGWAVNEARQRGCGMVQLTTNVERDDARQFYEALGFRATHIGMKLNLSDTAAAENGA